MLLALGAQVFDAPICHAQHLGRVAVEATIGAKDGRFRYLIGLYADGDSSEMALSRALAESLRRHVDILDFYPVEKSSDRDKIVLTAQFSSPDEGRYGTWTNADMQVTFKLSYPGGEPVGLWPIRFMKGTASADYEEETQSPFGPQGRIEIMIQEVVAENQVGNEELPQSSFDDLFKGLPFEAQASYIGDGPVPVIRTDIRYAPHAMRRPSALLSVSISGEVDNILFFFSCSDRTRGVLSGQSRTHEPRQRPARCDRQPPDSADWLSPAPDPWQAFYLFKYWPRTN